MTKDLIKKLTAALLCVANLCGSGVFAQAQVAESGVNDSGIMPVYTSISYAYSSISKNSNGSMTCRALTTVWSDNAGVRMELQQYKSGWTTLKTWEASSSDTVSLEKTWYVSSGYSYRVKATHYAYDGNGNLLESTVTYSSTVSY